MGGEGLEELFFLFVVVVPVEMQEVIEPQPMSTRYEPVGRDFRLQGTRCAESEYMERFFLRPLGARVKIDVDQCIQLVEDDVDVIRTDACGEHRDPFFPQVARMADEFPVLLGGFDGIKIFADFGHPARVAHGDDRIRQFFRPDVQMVDSPSGIDDQF